MFDLKSYLADKKSLVNATLKDMVENSVISDRMRRPVLYAIMAGGKRVRPILCLAASSAVSGEYQNALPAACALEMIHTYSLIHDDLPALDDDDLRRGQPTCHIKFNEATAILTGDALLNMAFEVLSEAGLSSPVDQAYCWLNVLSTISRAAGCRGMIEGQARDLAYEGVLLDPDQLQSLHNLKTGALIRAAVKSGAILGQGSETQINDLLCYAEAIGLAFQVVDDVLNVKGDPKILGKATGTDQAREKNTYPALLGLAQSEQYARALIDRALQAIASFDNKADPLRAIARYIIERNR